MAINKSDVVFKLPERVRTEDDGGGQMTGNELVSGQINNLWDDISRAALARGFAEPMKLYGHVKSDNVDKFLGAHMIIAKAPVSENVSVLLVNTDSHYDETADAKSAIERYVIISRRSALRPVGTQRKDQNSLTLYADKTTDEPDIGEVLWLIDDATDAEQAVKVTEVSRTREDYVYRDGDGKYATYSAYEFTVRISQPLNSDFGGDDPEPLANHDTQIFKTTASSNAKYYGIQPLAEPATAGDLQVVVEDIFQPIIPAATVETALVDQSPGIVQKTVQRAGDEISRSLGTLNGKHNITLPTAWVVGTLQLNVAGGIYEQSGDQLAHKSGADYLSDTSVNAADGTLTFTVSGNRSVTVEYAPGVSVELTPYTDRVEIGSGNRQTTYTDQLYPPPTPGSVRVDFQYLGKWYNMIDNGSGELEGAESSGTINYNTGSISLSLQAEPDADSAIIYTWAQSPYREGDRSDREAWFEVALQGNPVQGTVVVDWSRNSSNYTATADADNQLSAGAGEVVDNLVVFTPQNLPTSDVSITYTDHDASPQQQSESISQQLGGNLNISLGHTNITPGSVRFDIDLSYVSESQSGGQTYATRFLKTIKLYGRGNGALRTGGYPGVTVGSIDAVAGTVTIDCDQFQQFVIDYQKTDGVVGGWQKTEGYQTCRVESQNLDISYQSSTAGTSVTETIALSDLALNIALGDDYIVPGSVQLLLDNDELTDRAEGNLVRGWNRDTAAGTNVGNIDYANAVAVVDYESVREHISDLDISMRAIAVGAAASSAVLSAVFRTSGSPLRPSGLQFRARRAQDGALMLAESDNDGNISGSFNTSDTWDELPQPGMVNGYSIPIASTSPGGGSASGSVDHNAGYVEIEFTQPVVLESLTYNAVAYTTVPQDPAILGLDPVKLPASGRVPVFRDGYLCVIHHTDTVVEASPVAGQTIDCQRTNLAQLTITGDNGKLLDDAQYTVDLASGTTTLADPLNLVDANGNSLSTPINVHHRVEDEAVIGSAEVGGTLKITTELTHDYPAADTYVSAAIEYGTLQAKITNLFDQKIDQQGVFDDELNGDPAEGEFDDLNYPIEVSNLGCVHERWKIAFTSSTAYELIGEQLGVVGTGSINNDYAPINPMTDTPYMIIRANALNGGGWASSNIVRFNTESASAPVWPVRTGLPSSADVDDDEIWLEFRGDAD